VPGPLTPQDALAWIQEAGKGRYTSTRAMIRCSACARDWLVPRTTVTRWETGDAPIARAEAIG
jgi:hypothetical protein